MRKSVLSVAIFSLLLALALVNACGKDLRITVTDAGITLTWSAPTTYTDGSPLLVAGYRVYYGSAARSYNGSIDIKTNSITLDSAALFSGVSATYYFAVTAYDAAATESDYSNEVNTYISFK